ncbi:MAG: DUF1576 domain-containing protein, partial [Defluviitaleaceae bacterium]|nr:DUF1576 domain-containing protein [Defluviitaleaceae bacterium]
MNFFQEKFLQKPYRVHGFLFLAFIVAGVIYDSPRGVLTGLWRIFIGSDVLVTDYIYIGGFGATLVNVGLVGLLSIFALVLSKHEPGGLAMGTHGLAIGFAFFGKNPLNMLPIIIGGFLYAWVAKKPPSQCVLRAVLAACLAPAVTQVAYATDLPLPTSIGIGIGVGLLIGFLINPLAIHKEMAHMGYNLYNVGFAAGIIGMGIFAVYRLVGAYFYTSDNWSSGYDTHLTIFLLLVSAYFIFCGLIARGKKISLRFFYEPHKTGNDYFGTYREKVYLHMGVMGIACYLFMVVTQGA